MIEAKILIKTNVIIRSQVFPGLWLSVNALRQARRTELFAVLQEGLQAAEHQAFVEQLNQKC